MTDEQFKALMWVLMEILREIKENKHLPIEGKEGANNERNTRKASANTG